MTTEVMRRSRIRSGSWVLALICSVAPGLTSDATAQEARADTSVVAAGAHYGAGGLHRFFWPPSEEGSHRSPSAAGSRRSPSGSAVPTGFCTDSDP